MQTTEQSLLSVIEEFSTKKIMVIGDAMLDSYMEGVSERLCREAPVPVVDIERYVYVPGGAANTAVNLRSLGARVAFLSVIGQDPEGENLIQALQDRGVSAEHLLSSPNRKTLAKQRVVAGSQILVRFDQGTTSDMESDLEMQFIERLGGLFRECDSVVISDYSYGIITPGVLDALERLQKEQPGLIIVDSRDPRRYRSLNVTAVKPNYPETTALLGLELMKDDRQRLEQIEQHGRQVLDITGAQIAAITLDQEGALVFHRDDERPYRTYARPQPSSKATGAGDTFISALAVSLAAGAHVEHAAELASAAASIVVSKDGTAACFAEELREYFSTAEKFVTDVFQLVMRVTSYRRNGLRIVFTNGCFDILHRGHIAYLNRAKALGDILIVGLNSDESVRRLKGADRPINTLEDRAQVLAALSCVDHIVPFEQDTPRELIRVIRPDIFAKGGDYTRETLPEADLVEQMGGRVELLPYLEDHSTTSVIEKIRALFGQQAALDRTEASDRGGEEQHGT
jgi:D-beta-D-heptose 7-phosphate kinase/D-beta-D-heptose 1-phosphate adenosyltransferase